MARIETAKDHALEASRLLNSRSPHDGTLYPEQKRSAVAHALTALALKATEEKSKVDM